MLLKPIINQNGGGLDILLILLPLVCCILALGQPRGRGSRKRVTNSWYTTLDIQPAFEKLIKEVEIWRKEMMEVKEENMVNKLRNFIVGGGREERYRMKKMLSPRLYLLEDISGPIYFELTEVEGGGTIVTTSNDASINYGILKLMENLPKLSLKEFSNTCPECEKPVTEGSKLCPYCGKELQNLTE
jgi:hypothetical protein